ncbi:MAG: DUF4493 domain-containing protein [Alistipes sp.]|nr:DUF4493 domain-containing protein [Alistipes sp.]
MKKILFAIALAVVATACHTNEGGDVQVGKIAINAATRSEVSESEAADSFLLPENLMPSANDLKVEITGNNNAFTWATLTEFKEAVNGGLTFVSAPYSVTLSYGEKGAEGWSKPYFEGSTSVEVPMYGLTAEAAVEVEMKNSIIAIETTELFDGYFPQSSFKIKAIDWNSESEEMLFMNAGEVKITCEAIRQTGSVTTLESTITLRPTTRHKVVFDLSTAGNATVNVVFDGEIVETVELEYELNENA